MTNRRTTALSLGALLLLAAGGASAQSDLKIGFVNIQAVLQNAPQIPTLTNQLRDEFASRVSELQGLEEEFTEKGETYERDAEVMAEAERLSLERELQQLQRDLERRNATLQEDINIRRQELLNELQIEIVEDVQAYAEEEGFDLVVTEAIFASQAVDITAAVYQAIGGTLAPEEDADE